MSKKILKILSCCLLVIFMATGCRPAPRPVPQQPTAPQRPMAPEQRPMTPDQRIEDPTGRVAPQEPMVPQTREDRIGDRQQQMMQGQDQPRVGQELNVRADNIVNEIVRLEEVRRATVVITENTAVVGVNLTPDVQGEMTTETKRKIEDVVRRTDRQIDRVSVTADPELFQRIENIVRETGRGRPLSGFGREIEDLVRRITPGA